jgi:hypothetical protein
MPAPIKRKNDKSQFWWLRMKVPVRLGAFSSEVDTGSRQENASKQKTRTSVLIQSEPIML